jgi:hypothetical protein
MKPEEMDAMEWELRSALERRAAPESLKRNLLVRRRKRTAERRHARIVVWQRLAAMFVLAAALGGGYAWHAHEEQRRGEAAREQVLNALRMTNEALDQVGAQLETRDARKQAEK